MPAGEHRTGASGVLSIVSSDRRPRQLNKTMPIVVYIAYQYLTGRLVLRLSPSGGPTEFFITPKTQKIYIIVYKNIPYEKINK